MENQQLDLQMTGREGKLKKSMRSSFTEEEIAVLKNVVAKSLTDTQLAFFMKLSDSLGLNPFNKEIWAYRDKEGNLITMSGRDGFLKIAQKDNRWNGIYSTEVREGEEFSINFNNGNIDIKHTKTAKQGQILGAFAYCHPKGVETPTIEFVYFNDYNKGRFTWKSHPADMIKKVAETHTLKKAFGISGLQSDYDFEKNGDYVQAVQTENKQDELEGIFEEKSSGNESMEQAVEEAKKLTEKEKEVKEKLENHKEKEYYLDIIDQKKLTGELTVDVLENIESEL
jgi:phage recombination protein Bet